MAPRRIHFSYRKVDVVESGRERLHVGGDGVGHEVSHGAVHQDGRGAQGNEQEEQPGTKSDLLLLQNSLNKIG